MKNLIRKFFENLVKGDGREYDMYKINSLLKVGQKIPTRLQDDTTVNLTVAGYNDYNLADGKKSTLVLSGDISSIPEETYHKSVIEALPQKLKELIRPFDTENEIAIEDGKFYFCI